MSETGNLRFGNVNGSEEPVANPGESMLRGFVTDADWLEKSESSRKRFRGSLVEWFSSMGKDYPWRRTRDPYAVLVSELMLQQTRLTTVLEKKYFERFLRKFPDPASLAVADDGSLLKAWEGLGYYRRARMLREAARALVEQHGGTLPSGLDELRDLPGIGDYTANAIRAFAFDLPAVVVDGNVARVLARLTNFGQEIDSGAGKREVWSLAGRLADDAKPREYHSAIMELGQQVCKVGVPLCGSCPVERFCRAENPAALPRKRPRPGLTRVVEHAIWHREGDSVLLHQSDGARRNGLWHLPVRKAEEISGMKNLLVQPYPITRYLVELRVWANGTESAALRPGECMVAMRDLDSLAMAAPMRKALMTLLELENQM